MPKDFGVRSFILASAIMAVAVVVRAVLDTVLPGLPPFITLFPAVALCGLFCGAYAAAFACVAGLVVAVFLWIPPRWGFVPLSFTNGVAIGLFLAASGIVIGATSVLRSRLGAAVFAEQALQLGLNAGGVGTWDMDFRTRRITASPAAYALHFMPQDQRETRVRDWFRGMPAEDAALVRRAWQTALNEGGMAVFTYRLLGGPAPRWISARGRVVEAGGEKRLLVALVDVTAQVKVQEDLSLERERLHLALQAGALAVWDFHPATGHVAVDMRYAATMGFGDSTILTREQIGALIHPDDLPRVAAEHEKLVAAGDKYRIEYRTKTVSGEFIWVASQGMFVRGVVPSVPVRMLGIIQDITAAKQRETDLQELAAWRELLVREADHRIKNSLQMVIALLTMQLRGMTDMAAADALRQAIARVGAIAASHLALQSSDDLRQVDLAVTLKDLTAHFGALHPVISVGCEPCEPVMMEADRAIPLALVVSEVVTNALRHGFPGGRPGAVRVGLVQEGDDLLVRVSDDGVGMVAQPEGSGLGSRIIRSLAAQVGAVVEVESSSAGTVVVLRVPLQRDAAEPARVAAR
jgi:two-component sensor histidine kinase/PAS domain-containing protein